MQCASDTQDSEPTLAGLCGTSHSPTAKLAPTGRQLRRGVTQAWLVRCDVQRRNATICDVERYALSLVTIQTKMEWRSKMEIGSEVYEN